MLFDDDLFIKHAHALYSQLLEPFARSQIAYQQGFMGWQAIYNKYAFDTNRYPMSNKDAVYMNSQERLDLLCSIIDAIVEGDAFHEYIRNVIEARVEGKNERAREYAQKHLAYASETHQQIRVMRKEIERIYSDLGILNDTQDASSLLIQAFKEHIPYLKNKIADLEQVEVHNV
jgi:hypothetical protein